MTNVSISAQNVAIDSSYVASQRDSRVKAQGETGVLSHFYVRNWPFREAVLSGGKALAEMISGKPIEKRAIENAVDHDQGGGQEVNRTEKTENYPVKTSSQEPVESKGGGASDSNSGMMKVLAFITQLGLVSGQESTTVASEMTTARPLSQDISLDRAVLAQSVKECTELIAFLNVAINNALTEEQKTAANKALIICTSMVTFLGSWIGVGAGFGQLLAKQVVSGEKTDLLIKSIEGATKLWAAYKLHQLNQMTKKLEVQQEEIEVRDFDTHEVDMEAGGMDSNVRRRRNISQVEAAVTEPSTTTALERKYKAKLDSSIYGKIQEVVKYVGTQAAREGGELGVLSGVTMAPYLIAGVDPKTAIASIALSGMAGTAIPIAAYFGAKGALALGKQIEKCFNDTGWLTSKIETCLNAAGSWTKEMLEYALLSYAVHEFEELWGFDVKLWNLAEYSPWLSEKNMPFAAVAALLPYDADPTFWQAMIIIYAWTKNAVFPCTKLAAKQINQLYHKCKGDSLAVAGAGPSTHVPNISGVPAFPSVSAMRPMGEVGTSHQQFHGNVGFVPETPAHSSESMTQL
ncbi:hypothetical protein [Endozoicomonas atrinae]|uniref:hypothetical protein n=1 Tax=Endozoicomonas atrinae TaxID=1333660 RepID=UPI003B008359